MTDPAPPSRQVVQSDLLADVIAQALPPAVRLLVTRRVGREVLRGLEQRGWRLETSATTTVNTDALVALLTELDGQQRVTGERRPTILTTAYDRLKVRVQALRRMK